jgi:hypothetical protein
VTTVNGFESRLPLQTNSLTGWELWQEHLHGTLRQLWVWSRADPAKIEIDQPRRKSLRDEHPSSKLVSEGSGCAAT